MVGIPVAVIAIVEPAKQQGEHGIARVVPVPAVPLAAGDERRAREDRAAHQPATSSQEDHAGRRHEEQARVFSAHEEARRQPGQRGMAEASRSQRRGGGNGGDGGEHGEPRLDLSRPGPEDHRRCRHQHKDRRQRPGDVEMAAAHRVKQGGQPPAADKRPQGQGAFSAEAEGRHVRHLHEERHRSVEGTRHELETAGAKKSLRKLEVVGQGIAVGGGAQPLQQIERRRHAKKPQQQPMHPIEARPGDGGGGPPQEGRPASAGGEQQGQGAAVEKTKNAGGEEQPAEDTRTQGKRPARAGTPTQAFRNTEKAERHRAKSDAAKGLQRDDEQSGQNDANLSRMGPARWRNWKR